MVRIIGKVVQTSKIYVHIIDFMVNVTYNKTRGKDDSNKFVTDS